MATEEPWEGDWSLSLVACPVLQWITQVANIKLNGSQSKAK